MLVFDVDSSLDFAFIGSMLKTVLRIHSAAAASYALVLLFAPRLFWQLTAKDPATDFGIGIAQLLGAPMVLMACVTWLASNLPTSKLQRPFAYAILLYLSSGFVITLTQQIQGKMGPGAWSSPISYFLFSGLYAVALLRKERNSRLVTA